MRLWTIHPRHLDTKGLLALWREGLLAQKVLRGNTKGYRNHPQLARFKSTSDPAGAVSAYLRAVHEEASRRGYRFDGGKLAATDFAGPITCTRGQLLYEWAHLKNKLRARDPARRAEAEAVAEPDAHPLFRIVEGAVEPWEVVVKDGG
ncbi:MAG TPA: pyrimidine dimer DNA glycosylase/endonuclease V [Pyrinomonadaceae bacterium]|jgi:hypothetical protein